MKLSDKAQKSLQVVIDKFRMGDISPIVKFSLIKPHPEDVRPFWSWSLANRVIAYAQTGSVDVRGFKQWKNVNRKVVKGASASYILGPRTVKKEDADGEEKQVLIGWFSIPVFPIELTDGEEIPKFDYSPIELPPLQKAATALNVTTEYLPQTGDYKGMYMPKRKKIILNTHAEKTWFHELAHAAHDKLEGVKGGQHADQETVAEFTAHVLMHLYGFDDQTGNAWSYIASYCDDPLEAIYKATSTVEKVVNLLTELEESHA